MEKAWAVVQIIVALGIVAIGIMAAYNGKWESAALVITGGFALLTPFRRNRDRQQPESSAPPAAAAGEAGFIFLRLLPVLMLIALLICGCVTINNGNNLGEKNAIKTDADAKQDISGKANLPINGGAVTDSGAMKVAPAQ